MKYSASELVKRSSMQLVYLREKNMRILTKMMANGTAYQSHIVKDESLANIVAEEMRGCYTYDDNQIFFCIDMIKNGDFYEIKSVLNESGEDADEYDEWYLNSSLLQCAFYKSLIMRMDSDILFTPKFRVKEGYKKTYLKIDKNANYYLKFGKIGEYKVDVTDPDKLIDFYKNKINSLTDYYSAKNFDIEFKHKEFGLLEKYFTWEKIQ